MYFKLQSKGIYFENANFHLGGSFLVWTTVNFQKLTETEWNKLMGHSSCPRKVPSIKHTHTRTHARVCVWNDYCEKKFNRKLGYSLGRMPLTHNYNTTDRLLVLHSVDTKEKRNLQCWTASWFKTPEDWSSSLSTLCFPLKETPYCCFSCLRHWRCVSGPAPSPPPALLTPALAR